MIRFSSARCRHISTHLVVLIRVRILNPELEIVELKGNIILNGSTLIHVQMDTLKIGIGTPI